MRRDVRRRLIKAAKSGNTITYGSLMKEFHISRGGGQKSIGHVVGSISEYEDQNGRPLISAIVVRSGSESRICPKGQTGGGFLAFQLLIYQLIFDARRQIWEIRHLPLRKKTSCGSSKIKFGHTGKLMKTMNQSD